MTYPYNTYKIKSSKKRNIFNESANGNLSKLQKLVEENPLLLKITNKESNKCAIYYSFKHGHIETTTFLFHKGQKLDRNEIYSILLKTSDPSKLMRFYNDTIDFIPGFYNGITKEEYFFTLRVSCYQKASIDNLMSLIEIENMDISSITEEYKIYKNKPNTQFIRDLNLRLLLEQ